MAAKAKIKRGTDKWYIYVNHKGKRRNEMVGKGAKAEKLAANACAQLEIFSEKADFLRQTATFVLERRN